MTVLDPDNIPEGTPPLSTTLPDVPSGVWNFGFVPDPVRYEPGDVFLFQPKKPTLVQRRIQAVQRSLGVNPNYVGWTHAGIYIGNLTLVEAVVSGGVRVSHLLDRCCGTDLVLARRLANFNGLSDPSGKQFQTPLEVQQRIALEASIRLGQTYRKWDVVRWAYFSLFPRFYQANIGQVMGPGAVCSTLISDSIFLAIDTVISPQVFPRRPTFPADLALSQLLVDVQSQWVKLEQT